LDHQWIFDARYNLAPPHCSHVSISIPKTRLRLCAQVIDWFCVPVFFPALSVMLV
jgi:hypothetical protein